MRQGGWSESSTLLKHYVAIKPSKMKRELLGVVEEKPKNFGEWIRQFKRLIKPEFIEFKYIDYPNPKPKKSKKRGDTL